jgi:hypothetical protein
VTLKSVAASVLVLLLAAACGSNGKPAGSHPTPIASPTEDRATLQFVQLVHNYWVDLIAADGNAPVVCLNGPIQPAQCEARAAAQLVVQRRFLADLQATPAPAQFAAADQVLLSEVPKAIADLEGMISAARSGDKGALVQATATYVDEMEPHITDALDAIDTNMKHFR